MSRTVRHYPQGLEDHAHKDGLRFPQFLKHPDHYTGWAGEENLNGKTKKFFKKLANKRTRHAKD
jgi:hypothetical protein